MSLHQLLCFYNKNKHGKIPDKRRQKYQGFFCSDFTTVNCAFVGKASRYNFPRRDTDDISCTKWRGTMYSKFTQQISLIFVSRIVAHKTGVPLNCLFCSGFSRRSFVGKHSGDTETCAFFGRLFTHNAKPFVGKFLICQLANKKHAFSWKLYVC